VFAGDSRALRATTVVATLDAPIEPGKSAIWCASFLSAWKSLESDLAGESILLEGSPEVTAALHKAADPRPDVPQGGSYVAAGWNQKGVIDQIRKDMAKSFPSVAPPTFPGITPNSFVAYAYLEAKVKFTLPYFQSRKPLVFTDREGNETEVSSFGIRADDEYAYSQLRKQAEVLFVVRDRQYIPTSWALDLDRTSVDTQLVLAVVERQPTLEKALTLVEDGIVAGQGKRRQGELGPNDVLLVPDVTWRISHRFVDLEGKRFTNPKLAGQQLDVAQQDIEFRLNRGGAELKAEAKTMMLPIPTHYVFGRPFLLYMKLRGAQRPYFVMWVENAELMEKWASGVWARRARERT